MLRRGSVALLVLAGLTWSLCGCRGERVLSIRDCPLDHLIFEDAWTGTTFTVERAGVNLYYACEGGFHHNTLPPEGARDCRGPLGETVLEGRIGPERPCRGAAQRALAVYTVIPGAPCCTWSLFGEKKAASVTDDAHFRWLAPEAVPKLAAQPWTDIDLESYAVVDDELDPKPVNSLTATACRVKLPADLLRWLVY